MSTDFVIATDKSVLERVVRDAKKQTEITMSLTPDYPLLLSRPNWVFTYGTLKHNFARHNVLKDQHRVCKDAMTKDTDYLMWQNYPDDFPSVSKTDSVEDGAPLFGELYQVDVDTMLLLDQIESNGKLFRRKRVNIIWNYTEIDNNSNRSRTDKEAGAKEVQAWMYERMGPIPNADAFKGPILKSVKSAKRWSKRGFAYQFSYADADRWAARG